MKIKAGICSFDEAEWFISNGANELYFGLSDLPSHVDNLGENLCIGNRHDFENSIKFAHSHGCGLFVAVNDINVNVFGIDKALKKMQLLTECGIDGFIVASPEFILRYPKNAINPEWHLSCLAMCLNRPALSFYRSLGVKRFAVYQSLFPEEAISMFKDSGMESEVFLQADEICVNYDGLCQGCGGLFGNKKFCQLPFSMPGSSRKFHCIRPGLRADAHSFYVFAHNADWLKLVRKSDFSHRKQVFNFAKELLALVRESKDEEAFLSMSKQIFLDIRRLHD
ncbi:MAG: U32 family peptidase [Elusimicrobiales bacterium]|nr:U32 family peptidase [Elusimicrobiales bacterium]